MKELIVGFLFLPFISFSQGINSDSLTCIKIAQELEQDSTLSIWTYPGLKTNDYYCLGKYFADRDISLGIYYIITLGNESYVNHCRLLTYKKYNIQEYWIGKMFTEERINFLEGYNYVVKNYFKEKLGYELYNSIFSIDTTKINPYEIYKELSKYQKEDYVSASFVNDSCINIKINLRLIETKFDINLDSLYIMILTFRSNGLSSEIIDYKTIKNNGFQLKISEDGNFWFRTIFDFKAVDNVCSILENEDNIYYKILLKDVNICPKIVYSTKEIKDLKASSNK
jgi:hypothetical protein